MKIYQIHETGGQWEDSFDYIRGTYLHRDRAEAEKELLVNKEELRQQRYAKCQSCPIGDFDVIGENPLEIVRKACQDYCDHSQICEDIYASDFYCENEETYWDDKNYRIEEVEVVE